MKNYESTLADRLKGIRISCGKTQPQIAKKLGVTTTTVQNYENGSTTPRDIDILRIYRKLGGVSWSYLLDGKEMEDDFKLLSLITRLPLKQKSILIELIQTMI